MKDEYNPHKNGKYIKKNYKELWRKAGMGAEEDSFPLFPIKYKQKQNY
jgi:hypothetical protein